MEAVAVFAAEAALSAAFEALFAKLSAQDLLKYARRNNVESEVKKWTKFLRKMICVLDDAEKRQTGEGTIKLWLDEIRDLAYDIDDILDEFSYEVLRQKVTVETKASPSKVRKLIQTSCSCLSPRDIKFNVSLGSKMKEISQRLEVIDKEKESLNLKERATGGSNGVARLETSSLVKESQVYGRKKDKETLVNELLSSDFNGNPVSVVAIVGMSGLGKTTLAQLVYNDETISRSFDIKAWVCVSDEFDVLKITLRIIESFSSSACDMKDLNNAHNKLQDMLQGKKFLLILDNVCNENYSNWDNLSKPFTAGGLGSKVLMTTQIEKVATIAGAGLMHHLKKLELEECLSLLALHAFGVDTFNGQASLQEVGEQIAKKCDGLPLSAKALGGLLRGNFNPKDWQTVLNNNMWELPKDECPIFPALRVSYQYLPSHLKRCFAFCAIFPKDYKFDKDDLILMWMAEGLLEQSKLALSNFTEVGNRYFKDLLSRSFFQLWNGYSEGYKFVMHDLMNDLAILVSGGSSLHLNTYEESNNDMEFENLRQMSFTSRRYDVANRFEKLSISIRLRTFIGFNLYEGSSCLSNVILERVIPKMRCLRLLCLRGYDIKELPESISELKHLRQIDISFTKVRFLTESICCLLNLQILKLNGCLDLVQLPQEIRKLINLRVLDISKTDKLETMPSGIEHLKNLEILSKFIVGEMHGLMLKELNGLSLIRGELSIWGLEKVVDIQEARYANLKAKEGLVSLEFKWMEETGGADKEKQVQILDELQPHTTLQSLEIDGYNGKYFPKWVGDCCFTNLEALSLRGCKSASSLPPLGGMCSLKILKISGMREVKKVGKEFMGNASNSNNTFPLLETLILTEMHGLEEWSSGFRSGEETEVVFPRLQKMEIRDCPLLVGILPNKLPLLEEFSISKCPNLRNLKCQHPSLRKLVIKDCSTTALKTLGDLTSLKSLILENISNMICMDELLSMLGALEELKIINCKKLKSLVRNDKGKEVMVGLERLMIENCAKVASFGPMRLPSSLKEMKISTCEALKCLPEGFMLDGSSTSESALEKLSIWWCPYLTTFPRGRFPDLLVNLEIYFCQNLERMPKFSNSMKYIAIIGCGHLQNLPTFPASVAHLAIRDLTSLALESNAVEKGMPISSNNENVQCESTSVECIEIPNAKDVESGSKKMFGNCFLSLESLIIGGLNLTRLPENIPLFERMKHLEIYDCNNLRWLPKQMEELNCLQNLIISQCPKLELLAGQTLPRQLLFFGLDGCQRLIELLFARGFSPLVSLTHLNIDGRSCVLDLKQETPVFLPKLQVLWMNNFENLENLAAAFRLPSSIEELSIKKCAKLQELPILELSSNLGSLEIYDCPLLKKRCLDRKGEYWPLLSMIPHVEIDWEDAFVPSSVPAKREGLFLGCM